MSKIKEYFSQEKSQYLNCYIDIINQKVLGYLESGQKDLQKTQYTRLQNYLDNFKIAKKSKSKFQAFIESIEQNQQKSCPNLLYFFNKDFTGEILTHLIGQENESSKVRRIRFLNYFDFSNSSVLDSLRNFFLLFEQKGETQCIARILEEFSFVYQTQNEKNSQINADQVYTLSFAILMLNTDLHNSQIEEQNRMSQISFLKTVRYVLDATQLSDQKVNEIYINIKDNEIKFFSLERMQNKEKNYQFEEYLQFCREKNNFLKQISQNFLKEDLQQIYDNFNLNEIQNCLQIMQLQILRIIENQFSNYVKLIYFNDKYINSLNDIIKNNISDFQFEESEFLNVLLVNKLQTIKDQQIFKQYMLFLSSVSQFKQQFWILFRKVYLDKFLFIHSIYEDDILQGYRQTTYEVRKYIDQRNKQSNQNKGSFSQSLTYFLTFQSQQKYTDEIFKHEEIQIREIKLEYNLILQQQQQQIFQVILANFKNLTKDNFKLIIEDLKNIDHTEINGLDYQYLLLLINDIGIISNNRDTLMQYYEQTQPQNLFDIEVKSYLQQSNNIISNFQEQKEYTNQKELQQNFNKYTQILKMKIIKQINNIDINNQKIEQFIFFIENYLDNIQIDREDLDLNLIFLFLEKSIEKILKIDFTIYKYFVFNIINKVRVLNLEINYIKFYFQIIVKLDKVENNREKNEFLILILQNLDLQNLVIKNFKNIQTLFALIDQILNTINLQDINQDKFIFIQEQIFNLYQCEKTEQAQTEYLKIILKYYIRNFDQFQKNNMLSIITQIIGKVQLEDQLLNQNKQCNNYFQELTKMLYTANSEIETQLKK